MAKNRDKPYILEGKKGKGMIFRAKRTIPRGTLILTERPLFKQTLDRTEKSIIARVNQLSEEEQRRFWSLPNRHKKNMGVSAALAIFDMNALPCGNNNSTTGERAQEAGIFLEASRMNSSCRPNVNNKWNSALGRIEYWALRDIKKDEELTITYSSLLEGRDWRRKTLKNTFGFHCTCDACDLEGEELARSNERRQLIKTVVQETLPQANASSPLKLVEQISQIKASVEALKQEGLAHYQDILLFDGYKRCAALADRNRALSWLRAAHKATIIATGRDSHHSRYWKALMKSPQDDPLWGLCKTEGFDTISIPEPPEAGI